MADTPKDYRSGFIGLAGVPNSGKSSLLNQIVGQKISIISRCPQTTRERICGILTTESTQAVLVDMPGILSTADVFNTQLVENARNALRGCDVILHLRQATNTNLASERRVIEILEQLHRPIWLVWNKVDLRPPRPQQVVKAQADLPYEATHYISATKGEGVDRLLDEVLPRLPFGPMLYPDEDLSDRNLRFLAAEIVREKLFLFLHEEIPYATATYAEEWIDRPEGGCYAKIAIQTEREAHKKIIIGAKGQMLKKIGTAARKEIETLCGENIFLDLWVSVVPKWRRNLGELKRLGLAETD